MMDMLTRDKVKMLLLSALAIAILLALPRLAIVFFMKFNAGGKNYNISAGGVDFFIRFLVSYIIAFCLLLVNTSHYNIRTGGVKIDLNRFYHRLAVNILFYLLIKWISDQTSLHSTTIAASARFSNFLFNTSLVLEIILCILIAEIYRLMIKNQTIRIRNEVLQKANAERTFEALKSQVNPHFLFNSLNTIQAMIGKNDEGARAFVNNMAEVYRHILNNTDKAFISLKEELDSAEAYMKMLYGRHGDHLKIQVNIGSEYLQCFLPPVSLQILLENAVKHNIVSASQPLTVSITADEGGLTVSNTLQERKTRVHSTGKGLYNLEQRYRFISREEIRIFRSNGKFTVVMPLLKITDIITGG